MPQHKKVNLGAQLRKLAVKRGMSVQMIAEHTGASRTTVYNWFAGGGVTNAYRGVVKALIENLQNQ